jgi:hypothetical protein
MKRKDRLFFIEEFISVTSYENPISQLVKYLLTDESSAKDSSGKPEVCRCCALTNLKGIAWWRAFAPGRQFIRKTLKFPYENRSI